MEKPIILAVDDDPGVLAAVARDLRRHYASSFDISRAESGVAALERLREFKLAGRAVALLLVDQRMPGMTGVELLEQAIELFPNSKRALLTAYADTEAAIRAINEVRLDHYLMKPWTPPDERLYPVLDDLLEDWEAESGARMADPGLRLIGHRFSADAHAARDFLARNGVPFRWLDIADAEAGRLLAAARLDGGELP